MHRVAATISARSSFVTIINVLDCGDPQSRNSSILPPLHKRAAVFRHTPLELCGEFFWLPDTRFVKVPRGTDSMSVNRAYKQSLVRAVFAIGLRSEERRVGKESRYRW